MKKFENFISCSNVLKNRDIEQAHTNEIYRMGIIGQFNLCFELAWKALKEVMIKHGVIEGRTGSPREIIKQGVSIGFVNDEAIWIDMLNRRNTAVHVYNEDDANELVKLIYDNYIPAFEKLSLTLDLKIKEIEGA